MRYYTIYNNGLLIAGTSEALTKFYDTPVLELPEDYEEGKYIVVNNELVLNPDYEQEEAEKREADFKSKFFNIQGFGWYRKQPKGYQSAVESMNVLFNIANVSDGIQAGLIIFYQEPDFTKEEECTEEWLIEHQIIQPAMTKEAFMNLYVAFMTAWNTEEHENIGE